MINVAPTFESAPPTEVLFDDLFPMNEGRQYKLPDIWDDQDLSAVSISVAGLDNSTKFDQGSLEFKFSNLTESKNMTVEITLTDFEGKSSVHHIIFVFKVQQVVVSKVEKQLEEDFENNFTGVDVQMVD